MKVPDFWKTTVEEVDEAVSTLKRGKIVDTAKSAGGRPIYLIEYGKKNELYRTANLSSCLDANDSKYYADKSHSDYKPTLLLIGSVHGAEFEGMAALLNLINILETGVDFRGEENLYLNGITEKVNILIIPCANPDGRARVPYKSVVGMTMDEFRYYAQGAWADGSLCGYPACKTVHPMKKQDLEFMGGYFNDDGINPMHDEFFFHQSSETAFILKAVNDYVPDMTVQLHGGTNCTNGFLRGGFTPDPIKAKLRKFSEKLGARCGREGFVYIDKYPGHGEHSYPQASLNLTGVICHICGEPSISYESNQGLAYEGIRYTHEEIYKQHIYFFEELCKFIIDA